MPNDTALVTLLVIALYFFFVAQVLAGRGRLKIEAPATSGAPEFERIFRVQQNTLEWLPILLVPMWLCAIKLSDLGAASLGLVWIVGRVAYFIGYRQAPHRRLPGFVIQSTACALLFAGALIGIIRG